MLGRAGSQAPHLSGMGIGDHTADAVLLSIILQNLDLQSREGC